MKSWEKKMREWLEIRQKKMKENKSAMTLMSIKGEIQWG